MGQPQTHQDMGWLLLLSQPVSPVQLMLLARIWAHPLGPHSTALGSLEGTSWLWSRAASGLCDGGAVLTLVGEAGGHLLS